MSKTDTAVALGVLGLFALGGYWGAKKLGLFEKDTLETPTKSFWSKLFSSRSGPDALPTVIDYSDYEHPETIETSQNAPPMSSELVSQVQHHIKLVFEYLQRHPSENVADYYAAYPKTEWIRKFAFPELVNLQATQPNYLNATPVKTYNAYAAWAFLGHPGSYDFGGLSSDEVIRQALAGGWQA